MKAIILAAGMGSRLDNTPHHLPKALTLLTNHHSILDLQLQGLMPCLSLDQVWIVVGYRKETIMEKFPSLTYVFNPDFKKENTSKSLLRALEKLDEDVLWLNGDVVFHPLIIKNILLQNRTSMVVNQTVVGEEEVKYRTNPNGQIIEVSKHVKFPQGEALGINFFKREDLDQLKQNLESCQPTDYFEKGIEQGIQQGQVVWSFPVQLEECAEIDFPEDILHAKNLLQKWTLG